jgi:HEAT repeat protein
MAKKIAATLPGKGREADLSAYRTLLLGWLSDPEPGVVWSAAMDFTRRRDLHAELTDEERKQVLSAFVAHPFGKASKDALVMAVAAAKPTGAGEALVTALLSPGGRSIRGTVADALVEIGDGTVPGRIAAALPEAPARAQADLLQVLGAVGGAESVDVARAYVTNGTAEVRVEAAHALGRIARSVREEKPDAVVAGRTDLTGLLAMAKDARSQQAALWALAQLQDPDAVALLTKLAAEDDRDFVKTWAKRYRDRPRLSLILR